MTDIVRPILHDDKFSRARALCRTIRHADGYERQKALAALENMIEYWEWE